MADNVGSKVSFFLVGLGIGALVGVLFAPKSGEETRDYLSKRADEGRADLRCSGGPANFRERAPMNSSSAARTSPRASAIRSPLPSKPAAKHTSASPSLNL